MTGSMTCPMTASAMALVPELHRAFGDHVDFALLSAREAHPGEHHPQPRTPAEMTDQARRLRDHYGVPFPVLVDELDGRLHRLLDAKPNAAFLFDAGDALAFRSLWSADERRLRAALHAVAGGDAPRSAQSTAMMRPMAQALGFVDPVTARAGPRARRDLWRSALPMAVMARMSSAFGFLRPSRRGALGMVPP